MSFVHKPTVVAVAGGTVSYNLKHQCNLPQAKDWGHYDDAVFECSDCKQKWKILWTYSMMDEHPYWARVEEPPL
jgi:hypothetical protein